MPGLDLYLPVDYGRYKTPASSSQWRALLLLGSVCLLAHCAKQEKAPEPLVTVEAATAKRMTIERKVETEAVLYPLVETPLEPKISAPVVKFYVDRGAAVHAGQLLAELENQDLKAAVLETKGSYETALANYETFTKASLPQLLEKARLDLKAAQQARDEAQRIFESRQSLFAQGAIPRRDLETSRVNFTQAANQYQITLAQLKALESGGREQQMKAAEGQLASAKGRYEAALAQLSYSEIRSPIDGVVSDRLLNPGNTAMAGQPVITVMDITSVVARAHLPPQQAAWLHLGDPAKILVSSGQAEVPARVTMISPAVDPNSTTVEVWVTAANPSGELRPGATVHETMVAETVSDAVVIPAMALQTAEGGSTLVMVAGADGRAHQRNVTAGIRDGGSVEITNGLKAGEQVVTQGAYGLPDNTKIRIEKAQATAGP
jgi:HlyD family secretion protein